MKNKYKKHFGFSLLELMIILAITALLVQLAVPSYKSYIERAHRLEAQAKTIENQIKELQHQQ